MHEEHLYIMHHTCKHEHHVPAHRVKGDVPLEQTGLVIAFDRNKEIINQ